MNVMWLWLCSVAKSWTRELQSPGFSVLQYLLKFPQTHAHRVDDVIQPCITFYFNSLCRLLVFWPDDSVNIIPFLFSLPIFYFRSLLFHTVSYICCLTQSLFSGHGSWFHGDIFHFLGLFKLPMWLLLGFPGLRQLGLCLPCREDSKPEQVCCICSEAGARFPGWVTWEVCLYSFEVSAGIGFLCNSAPSPLCPDQTQPGMAGLVTFVGQQLLEEKAPPTKCPPCFLQCSAWCWLSKKKQSLVSASQGRSRGESCFDQKVGRIAELSSVQFGTVLWLLSDESHAGGSFGHAAASMFPCWCFSGCDPWSCRWVVSATGFLEATVLWIGY